MKRAKGSVLPSRASRRAAARDSSGVGGAPTAPRAARRRGEEDEDEPKECQEGTGPSASGFPSARIRTSSSWKKSAVARTCSGVLSA